MEAPKQKKTAAKSKGQKPKEPETTAEQAEPKSKIRRLRKHITADDVEGLEEDLGTEAPSPSTEEATQAAEVEVPEPEEEGDAKPKASRKKKVKKETKIKDKQPKAKGKAQVTAAAKSKTKAVSTKDVEVPKAKAKTSARKPRKGVGKVEDGEEGEPCAPIARRRGSQGGEAADVGDGGEGGGNAFFRLDNPLHELLVQDILKCLQMCKSCGECGKKGKHTHAIPKLDMDGAHHFQLSVYWSRNAVGIKARQNNVTTGQVAYFAKETPCCATNILLATMWAGSSTE